MFKPPDFKTHRWKYLNVNVTVVFGCQIFIIWDYPSVINKSQTILFLTLLIRSIFAGNFTSFKFMCYYIVSSPVFWVTIDIWCGIFNKCFRKLLWAFSIDHARRFWIKYSKRTVYHGFGDGFIQWRIEFFVGNSAQLIWLKSSELRGLLCSSNITNMRAWGSPRFWNSMTIRLAQTLPTIC